MAANCSTSRAEHTHPAARRHSCLSESRRLPRFGPARQNRYSKIPTLERVGAALRSGGRRAAGTGELTGGTATSLAASADGPRAALVRGAEAPRTDEVAHSLTLFDPIRTGARASGVSGR